MMNGRPYVVVNPIIFQGVEYQPGDEIRLTDELRAVLEGEQIGSFMPLFDGTPRPEPMARENTIRRYIATRRLAMSLHIDDLNGARIETIDVRPGDEIDLLDSVAAAFAREEPGAFFPAQMSVTTETVEKADTEGVFINTGEIDRSGFKATRSG